MGNTSILEQRVNEQTTFVTDESTTCLQDERNATVANRTDIAEVIFVLGLPASGKTTTIHDLRALLEWQGRNVICLNDYPLLLAGAAREQQPGPALRGARRFRQILDENGELRGFTVENGVVLEEVLCELNRDICQYLYQPNTVILVEFARDEYLYEHVWQHFCREILAAARYLFCDADFEVCIERVQHRLQRIDLEVMYTYYHKDGLASLLKNCNLDRIEVVNTDGTMQETNRQLAYFLEKLVREKLAREELFKAERAGARGDYRERSFRIVREGEGESEAFTRSQA